MADADQLARIQQAHHRRLLGLQATTGDLVGDAWDRWANLDDVSAARFTEAAATIVEQARSATSTLAAGYMMANDRAGGFPVAELAGVVPPIRNAVPSVAVYERSVVEARRRVAAGASWEEAMASGRARAVATARTDVVLTNRAAMAQGRSSRPWVVGYRRVLTGKSCAFCATASTQRYTVADLMPLHPSCDCDVAEIFGAEDPGRVINRELLDALKQAGEETGTPRYWNGPYMVDDTGSIRYRRIEYLRDDVTGRRLLDSNGNPLRRVVPGDKVSVEVVEHGELGPMLTDARHVTTVVDDLPAEVQDAVAAGEQAPRARIRATAQDPDVLAEASRRRITPDEVLARRQAKADRRLAEERARRAAARELSADSPEVVQLAERYGVDPDEVLTARARVADVRKLAREEAARVQAEAMEELDRLGAVKISNPPRVGARTAQGSQARRGEWDWLEQVSDREKARLSRQWYGSTQAPDQVTATFSEALNRDLTVDEAMELWLDLNRRAEAAGALRRGKLPSLDAYSGQIDVDMLAPELTDQGYRLDVVFGSDDLEAAAHIAARERELVAEEALQYLGDAARAVEGPAPYRMGFDSWFEELSDLEYLLDNGRIGPEGRRRLAELAPQYLDEPGLSWEELYSRIVSTARKAGEEVPDYARIPWA